jgi:hypothetical protein
LNVYVGLLFVWFFEGLLLIDEKFNCFYIFN